MWVVCFRKFLHMLHIASKVIPIDESVLRKMAHRLRGSVGDYGCVVKQKMKSTFLIRLQSYVMLWTKTERNFAVVFVLAITNFCW